jgi:uncharacterized protein (DUF983 family)
MAEALGSLIAKALRCRCPRCGQGSVFEGYLEVAPQCSVCGLKLAGNDTGDGPAFFIMLPLCIVTAVLALLLDKFVEPPIWVHMIIWPVFIALVVGYSLRPVKATMIALQYRYRDVERPSEGA